MSVDLTKPGELIFQPYSTQYNQGCLALFDANSPAYFHPDERDEYQKFLDFAPKGYEVCLQSNNLLGAYGLISQSAGVAHLNWILIDPKAQGFGIGRAIMARVIARSKDLRITTIHIAASHLSAPFFAKFGAQKSKVLENGWGQGMHRVDMVLALSVDS